METNIEYIKIPKERLGILIGRKGSVKKKIEELLSVKLYIDSKEGIIRIKNLSDDVLAVWKARDIVRAIGRGFSPEKALKLVSDDYILNIIDLTEIVGDSRKALIRQKGRIIGEGGRTRRFIEEMTGADLSIYGKTVSIIGTFDEVQVAREAVLMLANGKPHGAVYRMLQRKVRELKEKRLSLWKPRYF